MSAPREFPLDRALPNLVLAMSEAAMSEVFDAAVRPYGARLERCDIERIKYRPRRNCTLSYRLQLRDTAANHVYEQRVSARLFSAGDSARRAERAGAARLFPTRAGPALRHVPALDMLTWWWPNDPKLAAPGLFADECALRERVLPEVVSALSAGRGTLADYQMEIAQYVPEHRLCARVDLQWHADGERFSQRVYAKSSREPDAVAAHAFLRTLEASRAWRSGQLRTPRALLCQPDFNLHWQQAVPGQALLNRDAATFARMAAPLGAQLAALHGTPIETPRQLTGESLRAQLREVTEVLSYVVPASRAAVLRAAAHLGEGLEALAGLPAATLHGDLHAMNILVDGNTLAFIDLDGLRRGPAVLELGAWIAGGMYRALLDHSVPERDGAAWQALLDGYARAGGRVPSSHELAWATAWNLLCQRAWRCVVNLRPGRLEIVPRLIALACETAAQHSLEAG